MRRTRILLLAAVTLCLASPAFAGNYTPWDGWDQPWTRIWVNPWAEPWACTRFEYGHRCNAVWHAHHCSCVGDGSLGRRINEYYGPHGSARQYAR